MTGVANHTAREGYCCDRVANGFTCGSANSFLARKTLAANLWYRDITAPVDRTGRSAMRLSKALSCEVLEDGTRALVRLFAVAMPASRSSSTAAPAHQ